jgi:tetratricopeptide (TPR) repeat protein
MATLGRSAAEFSRLLDGCDRIASGSALKMISAERPTGDEPASTGRLDSWKEIAAYLRRSVRSARRWEKEEGLPVHRHLHSKRDSVYAFRAELDEWWTQRGAKVAEQNGEEDEAPAPPEAEPLPVVTDVEPAERSEETATAPLRPRRRAGLIGIGFALAVLVVGGVAWLTSRNGSHSGTAGTLAAAPPARDWVLVAKLENRTGEKLLDGTLDYALQRELSNSHQFSVVSGERINDALRLMRKPPDTPIDSVTAREVCLRDGGIRALVTGRMERLGNRYVLSAEILEPKKGASVAGFSEESTGVEGSLGAVRRMSDRIRATLGETPVPNEREQAALEKVTTANLKALQLYSEADLMMRHGDYQAAAEELLRQAVTEDPAFASAWIHLAWTIRNQERPLAEFQPPAETAMRLADTTTERERYFIRGSYYEMVGQREKAIAAYEALLELYPDHSWAANNVCHLYDWQFNKRDNAKAVEIEARTADSRPNDLYWNYQAAMTALFFTPDPAREKRFMGRASRLITPTIMASSSEAALFVELQPFTASWLTEEIKTANREVVRVAGILDSLDSGPRDRLAQSIAVAYMTLGRLEAAAQTCDRIEDSGLRNAMLAQVAFCKGDDVDLANRLKAGAGSQALAPGDPFLFLQARAGITQDAERVLKEAGDGPPSPGTLGNLGRHAVRGEIALAEGRLGDAARELEREWEVDGQVAVVPSSFYLSRESLATILVEQGNIPRAIEVLERRPERCTAAGSASGAFWLRNRFQLAELYRRVGRVKDAHAVEAELTRLLALADPDHPILAGLERLSRS